MNVVLFGATGMIGSGVLLECIDSPLVESVLVIGRSATGVSHAKISEVTLDDIGNLASVSHLLADRDACFFCLGVTSVGLSEQEYSSLTHDLTLTVARTMYAAAPNSVFVYISGAGADSSESGRTMWARVKGRTENGLLRIGFRAAFMLRPGFIQPVRGVRSRTGWYQAFYTILRPFSPLLRRLAPSVATTTSEVGRAMIRVAHGGYSSPILESRDINLAAASPSR
jgi:uncharacterized protein YbjT (DUF2867 family)